MSAATDMSSASHTCTIPRYCWPPTDVSMASLCLMSSKSLHAVVPITATDAARLRAVRLRIGSPSLASAVEDQGEHERAGLRHVEVVQAARALDRPAQVGLRVVSRVLGPAVEIPARHAH